ncbi:MAG: anti-sigma factor [Actinomycetota bacterium]|nr:anti-sigma factor [Actinomycetota bacterium]
MSRDNPPHRNPPGGGNAEGGAGDELDITGLAALARTLSVADTHLDSPPESVWAGIEALVAAGDSAAQADPSHSNVSAARPAQWFRRLPLVVGAAAAALLAVVAVAVLVGRDGDDADTIVAVQLSNAGLSPEGSASAATATLVRLAGGEYALDVRFTDLPTVPDGFMELWIIDTDVQGMYSLGPLHGDGRYPLPEHVDPAGFPVVDVSIEPPDGTPTHSGKSILRGQLNV